MGFDEEAIRKIAEHCHPYNPMVVVLRHTENPEALVRQSVNVTMKKEIPLTVEGNNSLLFKRLIQMNHTSLFEHINFTFEIKDISRSCLAQLTRHRIGSFTSSSQHYQDYSQYDLFFDETWYNHTLVLDVAYEAVLKYKLLLATGCPKEEARQVLPQAMGTNIIWSVNARSLFNFLNLRLCARNCKEIQLLAERILTLSDQICPNIFKYIGPDCFMKGSCSQGKLGNSCKFRKSSTVWARRESW